MAAPRVPGGRVRTAEEPVLQAGHGVQQQPQAGQQQDGDDKHAGPPPVDDSSRLPGPAPVMAGRE
ncbi:hypothetical protein [Streptomyces sp. NPDC059459]|uniref:hypothetical protein n=1 Tax=unclassified Streptomyces TaxID=2593676 RepID=UPI00369BFAFF